MSNSKNDIQNITSQVSLSPARDTVYEFNQAYQRASNTVHIFDDGTKMTTVEAHTLKHICQNEGCTITDLVNYWGAYKRNYFCPDNQPGKQGLPVQRKV